MGQEYILGGMAGSMKGNINLIRNMGMEYIFGQMAEVYLYLIV